MAVEKRVTLRYENHVGFAVAHDKCTFSEGFFMDVPKCVHI